RFIQFTIAATPSVNYYGIDSFLQGRLNPALFCSGLSQIRRSPEPLSLRISRWAAAPSPQSHSHSSVSMPANGAGTQSMLTPAKAALQTGVLVQGGEESN